MAPDDFLNVLQIQFAEKILNYFFLQENMLQY